MNPIFQDIFEQLGLADIADDQKESMLSQWEEMILQRVMMNLFDRLSEEERKEFESLPEEKVQEFIETKVPNFPEMLMIEASAFRDQLIADAAFIRGQIEGKNSSASNA